MTTLDKYPTYRGIHRYHTMLGGDYKMVLTLTVFCTLLVVVRMTPAFIAAAAVIWFSGLRILRRLALRDPLLFPVLYRQISYRHFYPAKSGLHTPRGKSRGRWI
jgi:type IV secretory pathway TrbD component